MKIVSFASQNPERQRQLSDGVARLLAPHPYDLGFAADEEDAIRKLPGAEVLIAGRLTERMFAAAESLKWFHNTNAGVEASLFPEFRESGVLLTNSRGIHGPYIAEWTLGALLHLAQRFDEAEAWRRDREWRQHKSVMTRRSFVLRGKRTLIVGYGSVGSAVQQVLSAVGLRCEAIVTTLRPAGIPLHPVANLPKIIGDFDVVIIAVPHTNQTVQLFDRDLLNRMKAGSILVNLARGSVVNEQELIGVLKNGPLSFAALDVFDTEPLPAHSPLFDLPNLFMTPHVSGNFPDYSKMVIELFLSNLERYLNRLPLVNVVDKQRGY